MREVYLDNSATTGCFPEVAEIVNKCMLEDYGNPSSLHHKGVVAEQHIKDASALIASRLKVSEKEIIYTSCGTEGDNLAIRGCAHANRRKGMHIITTCIEHPAVINTMIHLEQEGYEITFLPVNEFGLITAEDVKAALRPDTILVSVMYVNNEIGAVEPISEIGAMLKKEAPDVIFHTDAVQGFGKYRIFPKKENIDCMTVSGHKIHGPKGMGFLYVRDKVKIDPILFGGGQQHDMRSGTENVPGIAGMACAVQHSMNSLEEKVDRMYDLKAYFIERITQLPDVRIHGLTGRDSAPHIISAGFRNVRAEVLLHALEEKGIYVSSGSACASNHPGISGVLKAIGTDKDYLESTVRFSMSEFTSQEDIEYTCEALEELVPVLRRFTRR